MVNSVHHQPFWAAATQSLNIVWDKERGQKHKCWLEVGRGEHSEKTNIGIFFLLASRPIADQILSIGKDDDGEDGNDGD